MLVRRLDDVDVDVDGVGHEFVEHAVDGTEMPVRAAMLSRTQLFNITGHPAISVPCGMEDGRPIGLMLVGRHYGEETIYRAAATFERSGDWTTF